MFGVGAGVQKGEEVISRGTSNENDDWVKKVAKAKTIEWNCRMDFVGVLDASFKSGL